MSDSTEDQDRASIAQLNRVLTEHVVSATADRILLRDAVCGYVTLERSRGRSLERIVGVVDTILANAEAKANHGQHVVPLRNKGLAGELVAWCVEFWHNGKG